MPSISRKTPEQVGHRKQVKHARAPRVTIEVSPEIIDASIPKDSGHCVYAEAVKAALPHVKSVSVDLQTIRFSDPRSGRRYVYLTPRRAQTVLVQWDQGIRPEPHAVELRGGAVHPMNRPAKESPEKNGTQQPTGQAVIARKGRSMAPEVVGGKTPPQGALSSVRTSGRRREFGLRALER